MSTLGEKTTAAKRGAGKFLKRLIIIIGVIFIGVMVFLNYATFSEGVRAGIVLKISKKGAIFKTVEGQLDLQTLGAVNDRNQFSQTFEFSVHKSDQDVYEALEKASLDGKRVQIRYEEKYAKLFWLGDTKYFVTAVNVNTKSSQSSNSEDQVFD